LEHQSALLGRDRVGNILAAFSLALTDKIAETIRAEAGRGDMASAALVHIGFNQGISIEKLRTMIGLSHSATVRVVEQLGREGLVIKRRDVPGDLRMSSLTLTEQGLFEMKRALAARQGVIAGILDQLSARDITDLDALLKKAVPAVVESGDGQEVACRFCDVGVPPMSACASRFRPEALIMGSGAVIPRAILPSRPWRNW
jgi:MarR family transcriptional regulator, negative regulator of the multidrug operon emrRAB